MNRFVLDTNIVSALMCRDAQVLDCARLHEPRSLILTSPVAAEISYGIERLEPQTKRRRLLEREYQRLRGVLGWADWDEKAAHAFGRIKAELGKHGEMLDDWDIAVAASSKALRARLVTRNRKHLDRVPGLDIEVW